MASHWLFLCHVWSKLQCNERVRDAVEATLMGRDVRLVQRCDVDRIVAALERYGCYEVPVLIDTLESSFGALQVKQSERRAVPI